MASNPGECRQQVTNNGNATTLEQQLHRDQQGLPRIVAARWTCLGGQVLSILLDARHASLAKVCIQVFNIVAKSLRSIQMAERMPPTRIRFELYPSSA
jgi:hypothetical protein